MYLLRTQKCEGCNVCLDFCPLTNDPRIHNCKQCPDAPCAEACKYDAFYETSPGILAIDPDRCVGCGDCAKACPYDAIVIEDGIAKKCDLCGECINHCPLNALKVVETEEEKKEKEGTLGWKKLRTGEKVGVYWPSIQEAKLLERFLNVHREIVKRENIDLETLMKDFVEESGVYLDDEQFRGLLGLAKMELGGFSVLNPLLAREDIEEISIIRGSPIRVFVRGTGWRDTDISITSGEKVVEIANKMAYSLNRRLTAQEPRMNATLPDGSRLHAVIPPVSHEPAVTIRKFKSNPITPSELIGYGTISAEALAYIWLASLVDTNMLIAGSTGSGKTTTLNAILSFIPKNQRVISIEETPELVIYHPHHIRLVVNKERNIDMSELVKDTLRMRPDRVVVGEVRSKDEISAWIDTTLAGQGKGSIATIHGLTSRETINRIRSKGIPESDLSGLDLIIVQKRWTSNSGEEIRKVVEITEVEWDNGVKLTPIYVLNKKTKMLQRTKNRSRIMANVGELLAMNTTKEINKRGKFLARTSKNMEVAFDEISGYKS